MFNDARFIKKIIAVICVGSMLLVQSVTFAADKTAPSLKGASPYMNQTNAAVNVKISLKFSENIYKSKNFSKVKLTKSGKSVTISKSIYKNYIKIAHKYFLAYSSNYIITIPAYSVKDKAGNVLKKAIYIKFKTRAKSVNPTPTPVKTATPTVTPTVTPTITPTITPTPTPSAPYEMPMVSYDNVYYSSYGWSEWSPKGPNLGHTNTGESVAYFDVTPLVDNVNASINFADSEKTVTGPNDFSMTIRFNSQGNFEAMDGKAGDIFKPVATPPATPAPASYTANKVYHVKVAIHAGGKTYCAWVTPDGGSKVQIAKFYGFRSTAPNLDDVGKMFLVSEESEKNIKVEHFYIASADTPLYTNTPTPPAGSTPYPTPTAAVTAANDLEVQNALDDLTVGIIELDTSKTYSGFTVSRPLMIKANGAKISSGIIVNSNLVTIENANITTSKFLLTNPIGEVECRHGYLITPGRTGVMIKDGSITGEGITNFTKGIYCIASETKIGLTVDNVSFNWLRNGIVCGGANLTVINNTFTDVKYSVGGTENATFAQFTNNKFNFGTTAVEGIGLGEGVSFTQAPSQESLALMAYLRSNNSFAGYTDANDIHDYRSS